MRMVLLVTPAGGLAGVVGTLPPAAPEPPPAAPPPEAVPPSEGPPLASPVPGMPVAVLWLAPGLAEAPGPTPVPGSSPARFLCCVEPQPARTRPAATTRASPDSDLGRPPLLVRRF